MHIATSREGAEPLRLEGYGDDYACNRSFKWAPHGRIPEFDAKTYLTIEDQDNGLPAEYFRMPTSRL